MTHLNLRALLFSFLATVSCYIGCVRPDPPVPDTYLDYPLDVKGDALPDGSFRLRWNAIKSADFIGYQIVRNIGDSVPFVPSNQVPLTSIHKGLEQLTLIESADSTFFVDSSTVVATKTHLRVFAVLKNRNLSSRSVEMPIKSDAKEMELNPNDVLFAPEDRRIVIGDHVNNLLGIFNTDINLPVSITPNNNFIPNTEMGYGRFSNATELYIPSVIQFNNQTIVRNLNTINSFSSLLSTFNNDAIMYDKNLNLYFTINSQPPFVRSFKRATNINISSTQFSTPRLQTLYVFRQAPVNQEAIALSITGNNSDVIWFKYNTDGTGITQLKNLNTFTINITKRPFAIAPDNQMFLTGTKGLMFNRNMTLTDSLKLPEPEVRYPDMIFSNDGTRLYAIRNGANDRKERVVDVYKYPNFQRSIPFKSNPTRVFQDGTNLILVGRSPNNAKRTMIERIKL
jgi:hypothetical protein